MEKVCGTRYHYTFVGGTLVLGKIFPLDSFECYLTVLSVAAA
jgi:hypothetical protein